MRSTSAGEFFEINEKMVLINDDQCDIADIVLDGWLFEKKLNHSNHQPFSTKTRQFSSQKVRTIKSKNLIQGRRNWVRRVRHGVP